MCIHSPLGDDENETCAVCGATEYGDDTDKLKKRDGTCGKWFTTNAQAPNACPHTKLHLYVVLVSSLTSSQL